MSDAPAAETKTKAQLKAERRAKQEAQRAAKEALKKSKTELPKKPPAAPAPVEKTKQVPAETVPVKKEKKQQSFTEYPHEVNLFKHLYLNSKNVCKQLDKQNGSLHPAIIRFGTQYAEKTIVGSNARCAAFLAAIKHVILDYERPAQADFTRGLEVCLKDSVNYLNSCRPSSVPMQNALKFLKKQMNNLPPTISDEEAKSELISIIDKYINEQIDLADKAISNVMQQQISNGDVILVYGFSSLIYKILCKAFTDGQKFRVVIIDSRPHLEGREMLRRLAKTGIDCTYFLINAVSYIMPQVSKVFLGVHAILANGAAVSRVGTAQVAWEASGCNVPVLVACGTHKSCERVQTDSIVHNEIGDPDQIIESTQDTYKPSRLKDWKNRKTLNLLNLMYDVTPADLITAIITELEPVVPSTCVPVLLRMILNNN